MKLYLISHAFSVEVNSMSASGTLEFLKKPCVDALDMEDVLAFEGFHLGARFNLI